MAIQFARIEVVSRGSGGSACRSGAYNARSISTDLRTNVTYNFQSRGDNVHHEILLPSYVDQKFKDVNILMNAIEQSEKRKDSALIKNIVVALPDDKELNLQDRINISRRVIDKMKWIQEGLGVQLDIHKPHDGETNWHAHIILTTRRFTEDGKGLSPKKARDLEIEIKGGTKRYAFCEATMIHEICKDVINDYFKELDLENRVDMTSTMPQEHIGPVRMRSILNAAAERNEERAVAHLENIKDEHGVLDRITKTHSIFTKRDIERAVKEVGSTEVQSELIEKTLKSERLIHLYAMVDNDDDNKARGTDKDNDANNNALNNGKNQSETIYQKTDYYTTREVREEEQRTFRIATRINSLPNYGSENGNSNHRNDNHIIGLKEQIDSLEKDSLSLVQQQALSHILLSPSGIRVFRGRAGTGKSHVLGIAQLLSTRAGQKVIGLAPTNKAASELKGKGFEEAHTIKGFLFKLYNDRISLQENSLLIVDEAGMVGTSDYQELLKIAKSKNCNVILAGDERQLTSVDKGGMFEVFANEFGSFELSDIKRQSKQWGREMAIHFASGHVKSGIDILEANNGLKESADLEESMLALIEDFTSSKFDLKERLIITVRNKEVDALNYSIRTVLQGTGVLKGKEISVTRTGPDNKDLEDSYSAGDRVLFKATNKNLKIENGEFATLTKVSEDQFTATTDKGNEVIFNPNIMSEFRHGYASTVYKAQGASIKDVYVLHNRAGNNRNSYVAMTRHVEEIKLYSNKQSTSSRDVLIKQLSRIDEKSTSLIFYSSADIEEMRKKELNHLNAQNSENQTIFNKIANFTSAFAKKATLSIADRFHIDPKYYVFDEKPKAMVRVQEVIEKTVQDLETTETVKAETVKSREDDKAKVNTADFEGAKERKEQEATAFVDQEILAAKAVGASRASQVGDSYGASHKGATSAAEAQLKEPGNSYASSSWWSKQDGEDEIARLRNEVKYKAASVAHSLLGTPNKYLSNRMTLRYGSNGSLAVTIGGEKAGLWHDFSEDRGGDLFDLIQDRKNCNFKEAALYLHDTIGIGRADTLKLVWDSEARNKYVDHHKQLNNKQSVEKQGIRKIESLINRAVVIEEGSIAHQYLREVRGIDCRLGLDIKACSIFDKSVGTSGKNLPALVAFARDIDGNITGGQHLLLDPESGAKANISNPRKSFGKITGSFVEVSENSESRKNQVTIIAEGLETALSIKQAGIEAKILCSLGISNLKNYIPYAGEKIIIAADNDGEHSVTNKTILKAYCSLTENTHATVRIVQPEHIGDFNDILQKHGTGSHINAHNINSKVIKGIFESVIESFKANTLSEFLGNEKTNPGLTRQLKDDLSYVKQYNVAEDKILIGFQHSDRKGMQELASAQDKLLYAEKAIDNNTHILEDIKAFGGTVNKLELVRVIAGINKGGIASYLNEVRGKILDDFVTKQSAIFSQAKEQAKLPEEMLQVVRNEQKFLSDLVQNHKSAMVHYTFENSTLCTSAKIAYNEPKILSEVAKLHTDVQKQGVMGSKEVMEVFKSTNNIQEMYTVLDKACEDHCIDTTLATLSSAKELASTVDELLGVHTKEQGFLAGLHDNLRYPDRGQKLLNSINQAYTGKQENVLSDLSRSAAESIKTGALTEEQVFAELQTTTNLKASYISLDRTNEDHYINTNLEGFSAAKATTKTINEVLGVISKEHEFLAGLYGNLKYKDRDDNLLSSIKQAHEQKKNNIINQLHQATLAAIKTDAQTKQEVFKELQTTTDPKASYIKLDKACETHDLKARINELATAKQQADKPLDMFKAIEQEQKFLSSLHGNLRHPERSKDFINLIKQADNLQKNNVVGDLGSAVNHIMTHDIVKTLDLTNYLKSGASPLKMQQTLRGICEEHHTNFVHSNLDAIDQRHEIKVYGRNFTSKIDYLKHELNNPSHEFVKKEEINRSMDIHLKQMELQHQKTISLSMGGMEM